MNLVCKHYHGSWRVSVARIEHHCSLLCNAPIGKINSAVGGTPTNHVGSLSVKDESTDAACNPSSLVIRVRSRVLDIHYFGRACITLQLAHFVNVEGNESPLRGRDEMQPAEGINLP